MVLKTLKKKLLRVRGGGNFLKKRESCEISKGLLEKMQKIELFKKIKII